MRKQFTYDGLGKMYDPANLPVPHMGNIWWYILAQSLVQDSKGNARPPRTVLLGPYADEISAEKIAAEKVHDRYEVISLPTHDRNRAGQLVRHRKFADDNTPLPQVLRRMKRQAD